MLFEQIPSVHPPSKLSATEPFRITSIVLIPDGEEPPSLASMSKAYFSPPPLASLSKSTTGES